MDHAIFVGIVGYRDSDRKCGSAAESRSVADGVERLGGVAIGFRQAFSTGGMDRKQSLT